MISTYTPNSACNKGRKKMLFFSFSSSSLQHPHSSSSIFIRLAPGLFISSTARQLDVDRFWSFETNNISISSGLSGCRCWGRSRFLVEVGAWQINRASLCLKCLSLTLITSVTSPLTPWGRSRLAQDWALLFIASNWSTFALQCYPPRHGKLAWHLI